MSFTLPKLLIISRNIIEIVENTQSDSKSDTDILKPALNIKELDKLDLRVDLYKMGNILISIIQAS